MSATDVRENGLEAAVDENTELIILGTFPSFKSRGDWYYSNSNNQFWKIIGTIFQDKSIISQDIDGKNKLTKERKHFLKNKKIGLWDIIKSCEIIGSSDSSIEKPEYNDLTIIKKNCKKLKRIVFNGKKAFKYYKRYFKIIKDSDVKNWLNKMTNEGKNVLPSTSPACTSIKFDEKKIKWESLLKN